MLRYFPPDPKYKVHAMFHKFDNPERVSMTTSKGTRQPFHRLGYFEFDIEGRKVKLQAYKSAERESNELFIPFRDGTIRKGELRCCENISTSKKPLRMIIM